jgi:hypothetical protein
MIKLFIFIVFFDVSDCLVLISRIYKDKEEFVLSFAFKIARIVNGSFKITELLIELPFW